MVRPFAVDTSICPVTAAVIKVCRCAQPESLAGGPSSSSLALVSVQPFATSRTRLALIARARQRDRETHDFAAVGGSQIRRLRSGAFEITSAMHGLRHESQIIGIESVWIGSKREHMVLVQTVRDFSRSTRYPVLACRGLRLLSSGHRRAGVYFEAPSLRHSDLSHGRRSSVAGLNICDSEVRTCDPIATGVAARRQP